MGYYKLNTDGTIQSRSKQVDNTWLPLSALEIKEDGSYYTYYKQDGTADLEKEMEADKNNLLQTIEASVQSMLDNQAKNLGYDNIVSACSYAGYPNEFQDEAVKLGVWRSNVWSKAFEIQNSLDTVPTVDEVLSQLPKYEA